MTLETDLLIDRRRLKRRLLLWRLLTVTAVLVVAAILSAIMSTISVVIFVGAAASLCLMTKSICTIDLLNRRGGYVVAYGVFVIVPEIGHVTDAVARSPTAPLTGIHSVTRTCAWYCGFAVDAEPVPFGRTMTVTAVPPTSG